MASGESGEIRSSTSITDEELEWGAHAQYDSSHDQCIGGLSLEWSPFPQDETMHGLFEGQVKSLPKEIAIEDDGVYNGDKRVRLSYLELNQRATDIAAALTHLGVRTESMVAVMTHRCAGMIAALLGKTCPKWEERQALVLQGFRKQVLPLLHSIPRILQTARNSSWRIVRPTS